MSLAEHFEMPSTLESVVKRKERELETPSGKTRVYEFVPDHPVSEVPVLLAPGFGGTETIYEESIIEFVRGNRRKIITIDHPKFGGRKLREEENTSASTELSRRKETLLSLISSLETRGIEKIDAITHSEGTINLTEAVEKNPSSFRNIVFFAPAGLVDRTNKETFRQSIAHLAHNFFRGIASQANTPRSEAEERRKKTAIREGTIYVFKNVIRSLEEIFGIAKTSLKRSLENIRKSSDRDGLDLKIIVTVPINDTVFPLEEMKETLRELVREGVINGIITIGKRGDSSMGHSAPYESKDCLACVGSLFGTLEEKGSPS